MSQNEKNITLKLMILFLLFLLLYPACKKHENKEKEMSGNLGESEEAKISPVQVTSMVDRSNINIGDTITYSLVVKADSEISPKIPEMGARISGLRIVDMGAEGPKKEDGRRIWEKWYKLQADITGSYIIPEAQIIYQDPNGKMETVIAPQIFIEVTSGPEGEGDHGDIRGIKPLKEMKTDLAALYIWIGIVMTLIILAGLGAWIYYRRKGKTRTVHPPSPHEIALDALEVLRGSQDLENENFRIFYFRLSEILRGYMENRFSFPAQESTTEELIPRIESLGLTRGQKDAIRFLIRGEDMVKFARQRPSKEKALEDWEETRRLVLETMEEPSSVGEKS